MINDNLGINFPKNLNQILEITKKMNFTALCEEKTGVLLRLLASTKPGGQFLEIGTGTGVSTCWIIDGMNEESVLETVEINEENQSVAKRFLGERNNVEFYLEDASNFIMKIEKKYDFVFADSFPGKFNLKEKVLESINVGGYYIIDDLVPQVNWPDDDHPIKVRDLIRDLENDKRFQILKLNWASGIIVCVRKDN